MRGLCLVETVKIPIRGKNGIVRGEALVDSDLFDWLNRWRWHRHSHGYAARSRTHSLGEEKTKLHLLMHVEIAKVLGIWEFDREIDHINGNKLDNRASNLRSVTHRQNCHNTRVKSCSSIGLKGVVLTHNKTNPFAARIRVDSKRLHLGYYRTPEEAFAAYSRAARKYRGEFARLS